MRFTATMLIELPDEFVTTHYNGDDRKMRIEFMEALQECVETYGTVDVKSMWTRAEHTNVTTMQMRVEDD